MDLELARILALEDMQIVDDLHVGQGCVLRRPEPCRDSAVRLADRAI